MLERTSPEAKSTASSVTLLYAFSMVFLSVTSDLITPDEMRRFRLISSLFRLCFSFSAIAELQTKTEQKYQGKGNQ